MGLVTWNYTAVSRLLKSKSLSQVNANLGKIGYFWSMTREDFCNLEELSKEADAKSALRSTLMLGLLGFLSVLGLVLLFAITLTMRLLRSNRRGRAVFSSSLVSNPHLSSQEVRTLHQELSKIV